jgi:hypothetical protein
MFNLVNNYCIYSPYCMTSNAQMVALRFNMNYIYNKLFFLFCPEPYKHPKITKLNLNTFWMKQNYIKTTNTYYYFFLHFMNHLKFMEIQYNYQLLCLICFNGLSILIFDIPCHFPLNICRMSELNHLL